jgi:uncharacterized membrane protein
MKLKRTVGLALLIVGVLLVLTGVNSLALPPERPANMSADWASWLILGGVVLIRVGAQLNSLKLRFARGAARRTHGPE